MTRVSPPFCTKDEESACSVNVPQNADYTAAVITDGLHVLALVERQSLNDRQPPTCPPVFVLPAVRVPPLASAHARLMAARRVVTLLLGVFPRSFKVHELKPHRLIKIPSACYQVFSSPIRLVQLVAVLRDMLARRSPSIMAAYPAAALLSLHGRRVFPRSPALC